VAANRRRPLVAGNWKMNGLAASGLELARRLAAAPPAAAELLICPPATLLARVAPAVSGSPVALGGQDCHAEDAGAHTGDISAAMLADAGCAYVLVGHSERRSKLGESDALVAEKFVAARSRGLTPILCVGETRAQRDAGQTEQVVSRQLDAVIDRAGAEAMVGAVVAYEPVWAIGSGAPATPQQAQAVHAVLRARLAQRNAETAEGTRILYGGSIVGANARGLFAQPDIDGGLVGGASLRADELIAICTEAGA